MRALLTIRRVQLVLVRPENRKNTNLCRRSLYKDAFFKTKYGPGYFNSILDEAEQIVKPWAGYLRSGLGGFPGHIDS